MKCYKLLIYNDLRHVRQVFRFIALHARTHIEGEPEDLSHLSQVRRRLCLWVPLGQSRSGGRGGPTFHAIQNLLNHENKRQQC